MKSRPALAAIKESLALALAGIVFALVANALSPRGLSLARDYFPGASRPVIERAAKIPAPTKGATLETTHDALLTRLKEQGLQSAQSNQVMALFRDPRYEQELVIFVDARSPEEYEAGHIPGAYLFDRYHPEKYFAGLLPVCQTASEIVVYCGGGDCEDSEFTAITLKNAGIPSTNLLVYAGGFHEWTTNGGPIEAGERKSGTPPAPAK